MPPKKQSSPKKQSTETPKPKRESPFTPEQIAYGIEKSKKEHGTGKHWMTYASMKKQQDIASGKQTPKPTTKPRAPPSECVGKTEDKCLPPNCKWMKATPKRKAHCAKATTKLTKSQIAQLTQNEQDTDKSRRSQPKPASPKKQHKQQQQQDDEQL